MSNNKRILWPTGEATVVTAADAAVIAVEAFNNLTIVNVPALSQAATINVTVDPEIREGAKLIINVDQGATGRNVTMGTGIVGDDLTGVANDKDTITAVYNSADGAFRITGNHKTVDAA